MSFFTNKHVIIAMLAAPALAVITYFAVGHFAQPQAFAAQAGDHIALVAKSNCRYTSNKCTLINGDVRVDLAAENSKNSSDVLLKIDSALKIDGVRFAITDEHGTELLSGYGNAAQMTIGKHKLDQFTRLQLAVKSAGVIYYVETETTFFAHQTL